MSKAVSPITFEKENIGDLFRATESAWQEHLIKIPMISKEAWNTISYGISIESTVKFTKIGLLCKSATPF